MKNNLSRRKFIQAGTMATGGLLASRAIQLNAQPYGSTSKKVAPSDRLRFGIIGIGMKDPACLRVLLLFPELNVLQLLIFTTAGTHLQRRLQEIQTFIQRGNTRSCSIEKILIALLQLCLITGINVSLWTHVIRGKISTVRSLCRIPFLTVLK